MAFPGKVQYLKPHEIEGARMQKQKIVDVDGTEGMTHHVLDPKLRGTRRKGKAEVLTFDNVDKNGAVVTPGKVPKTK